MYACLAVTCHLHFWQNDRDFLRATVVTRGWNGYRNKSQHRKSTLEKKIFPPFQQGFEPATFQSRVRRSNHWAIPAPALRGSSNRFLYWVLVSCHGSGCCALCHVSNTSHGWGQNQSWVSAWQILISPGDTRPTAPPPPPPPPPPTHPPANSKHWFTTSFLQPLPYLVTP